MEEPSSRGTADGTTRGPHADPDNVGNEPAVGCAADPRRTLETRVRDQSEAIKESTPELKLLVEEKRGAIDVFTMWLPRIAVAVAFLFIGQGKFASQSMWVKIFNQIGFGQWFRYLTGTLQIVGAVLVLIPRTFTIGILTLACTMLGAVLVWLFVLHAPLSGPVCRKKSRI